ncbi:MAG TPA: mercuric transporter MerT family protein [Terriglobia bacterium]|nr:mercuric transporter MerT family protein [Terriglobia bacterium]
MTDQTRAFGLSLIGAVVAAVAASLCCVLPLAVAVLGVAGFAASEFFARWRPYLLAATLGLLAVGFYSAYRPRRGLACDSDSLCSRKPTRRWSRAALWVATVLVALFAAFPYYGGWIVMSAGTASNPAAAGVATPVAHAAFNIEGMDCQVCAASIEHSLRQMPGVVRAKVSFQEKRASIDYNPHKVDVAHLVMEITNAGFKAVRISSSRN